MEETPFTLPPPLQITFYFFEEKLFFYFRGNSERRVHVFLRHLEKMSHQFFEPEMGLSTPPGHFQQKRPKKNFQTAGGKFHSSTLGVIPYAEFMFFYAT